MLDPPDQASNARLSARDIACHMHPFTNMRRLESEGPFVVMRRDGIRVYDEGEHKCIDAMAGLWCAGLGFSEKRLAEAAYRQMLELPTRPHSASARTHGDRVGREAYVADADVEGVLQQLRLGGQRHGGAAGLVLQQHAGSAAQEEGPSVRAVGLMAGIELLRDKATRCEGRRWPRSSRRRHARPGC